MELTANKCLRVEMCAHLSDDVNRFRLMSRHLDTSLKCSVKWWTYLIVVTVEAIIRSVNKRTMEQRQQGLDKTFKI